MPEQVLARRDAARDCERDLALVLDELVDGPSVGSGVKSILLDLEPLQASDGALRRIWNLRPVVDKDIQKRRSSVDLQKARHTSR